MMKTGEKSAVRALLELDDALLESVSGGENNAAAGAEKSNLWVYESPQTEGRAGKENDLQEGIMRILRKRKAMERGIL